MASQSPPVPGTILGDRYAVIAPVVETPGYVELRARDQEVDVEIGLWWLRPELFADPERRDAVIGTGVELRALQDPTLRTCYGIVRGAGALWATWQLANGAGLAPDTGGAARPLAEVRRWFESVARALAALHAHGLVHGRMVPSDVVSIGSVLRLGGGGVWRDVDPVAALRCWQGVGADHYVAPEVRRHQAPTPAADVWSLATITLELIAGVSGASPDLARAAARRHPQLGAVLVGAMSPDPGRRPEIAALLEAVGNAAEAPYADAAPRGKAQARGGEAGTLLGHASGDATKVERPPQPPPQRPGVRPGKAPTHPPPLPAAKPMRTQPGLPPKPGAFAPQPASFALPTPTTAPPAPRPTRPVVAVQQPGSGPVSAPPKQPPAPAMPTPARVAIAGAIERARTAPPGEFVVASVSMKAEADRSGPIPIPQLEPQPPPSMPAAPTGETPHVPKAKIRPISDVQGGRSFSVAPGQMGYLAPPKAVSDARQKKERGRLVLWIVLIAVAAAVAGVALALLL